MPTHRASWKVRLIAFGIGIIVAAAIFGIALLVSDDLRLLYLSGALLLAVAAFLLRESAGRLDRRRAASFRLDVLVRVLRPAANTVSLANPSVVGGDCHVAAVPESIWQNNQNWCCCNIRRGLSLVLCFLRSGADAASVNACEERPGATVLFATH